MLEWTMYALWAAAGCCVLVYAALVSYINWIDMPRLDRHLGDAGAINGRGDRVTAETYRNGTSPLSATTVIRLSEAGAWFATTLLVAESRDYLVGFKWRVDYRLVLLLDFGCDGHITLPADRVGSIHVIYRFGYPAFPPHGYSSFPGDVVRKPCA